MIGTPSLGGIFFRLCYRRGSNLFHQSLADIIQQHAIDDTASAVAGNYNTVPHPVQKDGSTRNQSRADGARVGD
ncbi:Hypothetical protein GbCGDNIH6_8109 [Granulibacter bethesdensis]|nr:Hypothetical protein GbCGDNIH6_8109 [Granulibacter bethesdensis]